MNSFILVAPQRVLQALYDFQDETSYRNVTKSDAEYEVKFSNLAREMRKDCHPRNPKDDAVFAFRTMDIPPVSED